MLQVFGDQLGEFGAIFDEDVEIVTVSRPQANADETLFERLIRSRQLPTLRWVQSIKDSGATSRILPETIDADIRSSLLEQTAQASELIGELTGCSQVGIRLETLSAPMCPRFHVDHILCRMLITLSGVGTEWISNSDVDWAVFDDLETSELPIQDPRQIKRLCTGHWSLLKGGAWQNRFRGVVHRSPHEVGERLLLALDPVF